MKAYAISVQWGSGMHYFRAYEADPNKAMQTAASVQILNRQTKKLSAKTPRPKTYVWKLIETFDHQG